MKLKNINFTKTESSVISLMASGLTDNEISSKLHFYKNYVRVLIHRTYVKYKLRNRYELIAVFVNSYLSIFSV